MAKNVDMDRARQGRWGRPILLVLVLGLILALIVWFFLGIYGESIDSGAQIGAMTPLVALG